MQPFIEEQIGQKGEVKVAEWIRDSFVAWTNAYNKKALSYGNYRGHAYEQWRLFHAVMPCS